MEIHEMRNERVEDNYKDYQLPPQAFTLNGEVFFSVAQYSEAMKRRNIDYTLAKLMLNSVEAGLTPYGHYYEIKPYNGVYDSSLCYTLYDKRGVKIPCMTRAEEKRYPKKSAKFASERVKILSKIYQKV